MPWLQSQIFDRRGGGWRWFPQAILSTPLCCPSRASILTGRYAHHTGVEGNGDGVNLDESETLATRLPMPRLRDRVDRQVPERVPMGPWSLRPPRWYRWVAKSNPDKGHDLREIQPDRSGRAAVRGRLGTGRIRDRSARRLRDLVRADEADRSAVLPIYTRRAPPAPWIPAPRYNGASPAPIPTPADRLLDHVRGTAPCTVRVPISGRRTPSTRRSYGAGGRPSSRSTTRFGGSSTPCGTG